MSINLDNIPHELQQCPSWCVYGVPGLAQKCPANPKTLQARKKGGAADYTTAVSRVAFGQAEGVGFDFNSNGFVGTDLDHVRNPITGEVLPWAQTILDAFSGTYIEYSLSGTGYHIIAKGSIPKSFKNHKIDPADASVGIEMMGPTGFIALTGNVCNAAPVADCGAAIMAVYEQYSTKKAKDAAAELPPARSLLTDAQVLEKASKQEKFAKLYAGEWQGFKEYPSQSEADQGFCNVLAFWCGRDIEQMDRIFRTSELYREKWERDDYRTATLESAARDCRVIYDPTGTAAQDFAGMSETEGFETIDAIDLYKLNLTPIKFIIEKLLPQGLTLLCAPSKYGKSWLSLDMVLSVAGGWKFLNHSTNRADTLYLALEDGYNRLKERMTKITMGLPPPSGVRFALRAKTIDQGLEKQIDAHMRKHPSTGLIIVDVLARVRTGNPQRGMSAYALDYADMGALKDIADKHEITVLCVHHDRKMKDDADYFNKISGTNGIMGAADTIMLITREKREDDTSVLRITGRDVESQELVMRLDLQTTYRWKLVSTVEAEEQDRAKREYESDPVITTIRGLLKDSPQGLVLTASEIKDRMTDFADEVIPEKQIGHAIKRLEPDMFKYDRIVHKKTSAGYRTHVFTIKP